jgi:hypothetical protein
MLPQFQVIEASVDRYLAGKIALYQLEDSLAEALWDADPAQNPQLAKLVAAVHLAIEDFAKGALLLQRFHDRLRAIVRPWSPANEPILGNSRTALQTYSKRRDQMKTSQEVERSSALKLHVRRIPAGVASGASTISEPRKLQLTA